MSPLELVIIQSCISLGFSEVTISFTFPQKELCSYFLGTTLNLFIYLFVNEHLKGLTPYRHETDMIFDTTTQADMCLRCPLVFVYFLPMESKKWRKVRTGLHLSCDLTGNHTNIQNNNLDIVLQSLLPTYFNLHSWELTKEILMNVSKPIISKHCMKQIQT